MHPTDHPPYIGGFEILGEIGRGGMGVVYRARDPALQRELAIKLQSGNWEQHPEEMERFLREARILAKINHPNVVQIYSVGTHEGAPFFAMELLEQAVADAARLRMPGVAQLKRWMLDAARGLAAIHDMGVVHRDIKPANLLLTTPTSVESEHVKIADLGIASASDLFGGRLTQAGMVLGTTGYLAPEAWFPDAVLDGRADQYALGVVYFELLTGRSPHTFQSDAEAINVMMSPPDAPDVRSFRPDIDDATAELIARMLKPRPRDRFESSAELVQAMLSTMPAGTADYRVPTPRPIARPAARADADVTRVRLEEGPTLARKDAGGTSPSRTLQTWAMLLPALLLMPILAWYFLVYAGKSVAPEAPRVVESTEEESGDTEDPAVVVVPAQAASSAWADYLLGHYTLKTESTEATWILSLLEHDNGDLRAELAGLDDKPIKLRATVDSQVDEIRGDSTWTISRVSFKGKGGFEMVLRIEFDEEQTIGSGVMKRAGIDERLTIVDGTDL